jgi:hypothetical protein
MQPHRMMGVATPVPLSSSTAAFAFPIAVLIVYSVPVLRHASLLLVLDFRPICRPSKSAVRDHSSDTTTGPTKGVN